MGAALECEFCHRKFKEDELVFVGETSRKVFCCAGDTGRDQLICVAGFKKKNPEYMEQATVMTYRGGACSCVDKNRVY
ncbi:MAG: hypothetical protein G01um10143_103 [Parcubacteria group bacterium Gr01-1014_3]|nr:MAG: hypothetical protein G01um10143_103 [Parcubacteria group bacterium Gr01-1014_3]